MNVPTTTQDARASMTEPVNQGPEYLTSDDLCKTLRIHRNTALSLLNSGEIEGAFRIVREWRIPRGAIEKYVARQTEEARQRRHRKS